MYKRRPRPSPPREKKREKCGRGTEGPSRLQAHLEGGDGLPAGPHPRGGFWALFGVAMFLKRCDPGGLCSANNGIRAEGLDDGRYGSEELGPLRSPQAGAAKERLR